MLDRKMVINELRKRGYIAEEKNIVKNGVLCDGISIHLPETKMENEKSSERFWCNLYGYFRRNERNGKLEF